jgi:glycosyltransferase involved in cell wall biosynthesis
MSEGANQMESSHGRPTILIVAPFNVVPPQDGASTRIAAMARTLSRRFRVIMVAPNDGRTGEPGNHGIPGVDYQVIGRPNRLARYYSGAFVRAVARKFQDQRVAIVIGTLYLAGPNAVAIAKRLKVPLAFDNHNSEHQRFAMLGKGAIGRGMRIYETWLARKSRVVAVVSPEDLEAHLRLGIPRTKLVLAPNGYAATEYHFDPERGRAWRETLGITETMRVILFFGKMDYAPNHDAAMAIIRDIAPRTSDPALLFILAGGGLKPDVLPRNVWYLGRVPSIAELLNGSDLFFAPLESGGGTKFKVIEALATGCSVLTTPVGIEGLGSALELEAIVHAGKDWPSLVMKAARLARFYNPPSPRRLLAIAPFEWTNGLAAFSDMLAAIAEERQTKR